MMVGDPHGTPDGTFARSNQVATFVLVILGRYFLRILDLIFALLSWHFDLVSDPIWSKGVGFGVGARGGSTWTGGDNFRGALG